MKAIKKNYSDFITNSVSVTSAAGGNTLQVTRKYLKKLLFYIQMIKQARPAQLRESKATHYFTQKVENKTIL